MVTIYNKQRKCAVDKTHLHTLLQHILDIVEYSDFDIGLLITNNKTMHAYNKTYRQKDKPTNILSFSYHPTLKAGRRIAVKSEDDKNLGDLIISLEYINEQAHEMNIPAAEHIKNLLVHGVCHLLGYDHETESQYRTMKAKEASILKQLS